MKRSGLLGLAGWMALAGMAPFCGCVAVNVGEPKVYTHTDTHFETSSSPSATRVETARAQMDQTGSALAVGIAADVREEFPKLRWEETATVRVQKRLGIGLFPGAAEFYLRPEGSLYPIFFSDRNGTHGQEYNLYSSKGTSYWAVQFGGLFVFGLPQALGTIGTLLVEPFSGW